MSKQISGCTTVYTLYVGMALTGSRGNARLLTVVCIHLDDRNHFDCEVEDITIHFLTGQLCSWSGPGNVERNFGITGQQDTQFEFLWRGVADVDDDTKRVEAFEKFCKHRFHCVGLQV